MTITRVFQDGVEFFTVIETGESGLSESGVSRLVGVSQKGSPRIAVVATKYGI